MVLIVTTTTAPTNLPTLPTDPAHARALALAQYRADNPRSRAVDVIAWARNGGMTKSLRCVLDGEESPTFAAKWPMTRAVKNWRDEKITALFGQIGSCA